MNANSPLLIANGQGFWGDSILGPVRLVREGPLHYLTLDFGDEVMCVVKNGALACAISSE